MFDCFSSFKAIHTGELPTVPGNDCPFVEDPHRAQSVPLRDLEVVRIVGRSQLHGPGAEFRSNGFVGHDRDFPLDERQQHGTTDQIPVSSVLGVHRNRRIAQHGLGPGSGHSHSPINIDKWVGDVHHLAHVFLVFDLDLGDSGLTAWAPVDDAVSPVYEAIVV